MNVDAVGDEPDDDPLIGEDRAGRARLAVVEWWHRVEEVGRVAGAGVDRARGGRGIGIGVADGGNGPGRRDDLDRLEGAGELGSQGEHADAPRQPCANLVEVRVTPPGRIVGTEAAR